MLLIILCRSVVSVAQVIDKRGLVPVRQEPQPEAAVRNNVEDKEPVLQEDVPPLPASDSLDLSAPDSLLLAASDSTLAAQDSAAKLTVRPKSALERPAFSAAKDSVIEDFTGGRRVIYYYGDVSVKYGKTEITANYMAYDLDNNIVYARGTKDYDNNWVGQPVLKDGKTEYKMEEIYYSFDTRKARIKNMVTNQQDGELRGERLKMLEDQSVNIAGGKYTVCNAEHPHYYLQMTAAKIITKPSQHTVFGPAYLVVEDVPLPLALPFGFVPDMPDRASGIMMPTYGEENARGLYLRDLGYYIVVNDHLDISLTGDIYSYGSWALELTSRYKKRYAYSGDLNVTYSVDKTGEKGTSSYNESKNFGVKWSHAQDSKARPGTTFRASVNFSSPSNNRYNSTSVSEAVQSQTSSSISYSKTLSFGSISVNMLHSQNTKDSSYVFTLPNLTFNVNRFFPFKRKVRSGKERFYEQISFSYSTSFQNKINFKASEFMQEGFADKFNNGMSHKVTIGLPSFTLLKYFNFSPGVSYGANMYFRKTTQFYNQETEKVESVMSGQFSTLGFTQNYSASISMSTRIYGLFQFNPKGTLQAIRHMITPSFSLSYHPELGTAANGWRTLTYLNSKGEEVTKEYNIYAGQMNSPPGKGKSGSLSFSFGNNLEAKVKDLKDTTGVGTKKIKLIDQLSVGGSYNFMADSLRLSTISISGSTTVFGKVGINGNLTLDPYDVNERGVRCNKFLIATRHRLARVTNASASLSYSLNGKGSIDGNDGRRDPSGIQPSHDDYYRVYYHPITGEYIPGGWVYYMNPEVPWSLSFSMNLAYTGSYSYTNNQLQKVDKFTRTATMSGQIRITKALNVSLNTGFDLSSMTMTTSQLSATYDLHCFNMSVSWVPSGKWQSWGFRIAANASTLSSLLKYDKSSSFWDK
ncbi:MAG: LPS-assembly protein LptD [Bacteroidales bacterium]|nr:LPS-assembly protein LptD [Bacteroidales bacterium]